MVRVNLLPPEILEKRKSEQHWVFVRLGGVVVVAALVLAYLVPSVIVIEKQSDLSLAQQDAANFQREAERYKIFEDKQSDLQARQAVANVALTGEDDWSRLLNELSLVLPPDVWVTNIQVGEDQGVNITGSASDATATDAPESGHKSIAKLLVRLADLDQLSNVWLTLSTIQRVPGQDAVVNFQVQADVTSTPPPVSQSVPAPPVSPAQNTQ